MFQHRSNQYIQHRSNQYIQHNGSNPPVNYSRTNNYNNMDSIKDLMDKYNKTYSASDGSNSYSVNPPPITNTNTHKYTNPTFTNNIYNAFNDNDNNINNNSNNGTQNNNYISNNSLFNRPTNTNKHCTCTECVNNVNRNNNINNDINNISITAECTIDGCNYNDEYLSNILPRLSLPDSLNSNTSNTTVSSASSDLSHKQINRYITTMHGVQKNTNKKKKSTRGRKRIDRSEFINEQGRYQCKICPKSYKRYNDLKGHYAIHAKNTESCPHCARKFSRPIYLRDHIRTHTGEKPFACEICAKRFAAKRNLVQHRKRHFKPNSRLNEHI